MSNRRNQLETYVREPSRGLSHWLPWIVTLLVAVFYATQVRVPADTDWDLSEFGRIPVVVDGRHMPMDTFARTSLMFIRKREEANFEPWKQATDHPKMVSAIEWAAEVMTNPDVADKRPVFRIDNPELKGFFGLPMDPDPAKKADGKHYAWADFQPRWLEFIAEVQRASQKDSKLRSAYELAVMDLAKAAQAYHRMKLTFGPAVTGDLAAGLADYHQHLTAWREAVKASMEGGKPDSEALRWGDDNRMSAALIAPRTGGATVKETIWASAFEEVLALDRQEPAPTLSSYAQMAAAFRTGDHAGFATAVRGHLSSIEARSVFTADLTKASREQLMNFATPFYYGMFMAVLAGLFAIAYWFDPARMEWARRTAKYLLILTLIVHTSGFIARFLIEGKPPVTSLYTSAIFIGWGATILGLLLESFFPFSIGIVVATTIEFVALWIAQYLADRDGTTFTVLEAVLNTNFWLSTHVVIVTLGYTSTFVAGILAIVYVIFGAFTDRLSKPISELTSKPGGEAQATGGKPLGKVLATMVYAIACFATLFSFVGTVLGGLWADQSWGRFWGWDVKENGALMIVIWNALLLHARWGGLVRERGLMCLAIFGNAVTCWSWFGVNTLAIGLHSYGFTSGIQMSVAIFAGSQVVLIIFALCTCAPSSGRPPAGPVAAA